MVRRALTEVIKNQTKRRSRVSFSGVGFQLRISISCPTQIDYMLVDAVTGYTCVNMTCLHMRGQVTHKK